MAKTAVALYETLVDSRQVVEELAMSGYSRSDIQVLDQDQSDTFNILVNAGLPEADAEAYRNGLRHGGHLVMLTTTEDMVDAAVYIMESHNSINVHDQRSWALDRTADQATWHNEETAGLHAVEEGIRYEEYQNEPGTARRQDVIDPDDAQERVLPRQGYVEESLR